MGFGMWFSWFRQNANQKFRADKMPTTEKSLDKMPTFGWHYVRLAFCPVGILSYHRKYDHNRSNFATPPCIVLQWDISKTLNCALFASGVAPPVQYSPSSHISSLLPQFQGGALMYPRIRRAWTLNIIVNIPQLVFWVENHTLTQANLWQVYQRIPRGSAYPVPRRR